MLSLIQNLLEVYRIDDGTPSLDYSSVNMALVAGGCVAQLTAIAEDSGVKLSLNFAEGDHTISADLISMRRILMNLVGNAIKFTVSGGSVVVSGHRLGSTYIVEVEDTGSGIPKHELDLLFRRFSQTVLAKRCGAGTGLGLYLCRQLVEAHGGHINCSSEEGVGSTFKVVLPSEHGVNELLSKSGGHDKQPIDDSDRSKQATAI
jgi:two-component system sensor histidine kinase/response regulator